MLTRKKTIGTVGYMGGVMALPEPFVWSWTQMLEFNRESMCQEDEQILHTRTKLSLHPAGRNDLVSKMRGDWLLQLDTDMVFDPDFCARLVSTMQRYDLDILTGMYVYKSDPRIPTLYMYNEDTQQHEPVGSWDSSQELFEVDSAGAGCLLVKRKVYERIVTELHEPPFDLIHKGEDHSFFMRAKKLGYKAYCAWKIQAAHLGYQQHVHQFDADIPLLHQYQKNHLSKGELHQ